MTRVSRRLPCERCGGANRQLAVPVDSDGLIAKAVEIMEAAKEAGDYRTAIVAIEVIAKLAGRWIERREIGPPGSFRPADELGCKSLAS